MVQSRSIFSMPFGSLGRLFSFSFGRRINSLNNFRFFLGWRFRLNRFVLSMNRFFVAFGFGRLLCIRSVCLRLCWLFFSGGNVRLFFHFLNLYPRAMPTIYTLNFDSCIFLGGIILSCSSSTPNFLYVDSCFSFSFVFVLRLVFFNCFWCNDIFVFDFRFTFFYLLACFWDNGLF